MPKISDKGDLSAESLLEQISKILKADTAQRVRVSSASDAEGVRIILEIPKGSKNLSPHVQALAALVAGAAT